MTDSYRVPLWNRFFRFFLRPVFRLVLYILATVRVIGTENVPRSGPYLIAINHISIMEPPFILAFWPVAPEAAGAKEIWERPGQSLLARLYGGIPVHRGEYDREVVEKMLAALDSGRPLVIAPEGTRSHNYAMQQAEPGIAYIIDRARVPVIPVGIVGSRDDFLKRAFRFKRPLLEMRIGKPFLLPPVTGKGEERRHSRQENADRVMYAIAELMPHEYQGFYQKAS